MRLTDENQSIESIGGVTVVRSPVATICLGHDPAEVDAVLKAVSGNASGSHYNPDEPRVPKGNPGTGGRWTDEDWELTPAAAHSPKPSVDPTTLKKKNLVNKYAALAQSVANRLGTTQKNVLTLIAKESNWDMGNGPTRPGHNFVQDGNNPFSIHCNGDQPIGSAYRCEQSDKDPNVYVAYFKSYADSGDAFVNAVKSKISGVTDPTQFVKTLQNDYGFGWARRLDANGHPAYDAHGKPLYDPSPKYASDFMLIYRNLPEPDDP